MIWLLIAGRDLYRNARRTLFAVAVVLVGAAATLAAAGYVLATFAAVREATIRGGVGHLQIALTDEFSGYEQQILEHGLTRLDVVRIENVVQESPGVAFAMPRLAFQGIVSVGERSLVALGEGVDPLRERRLAAQQQSLVAGVGLERLPVDDAYAAVIGQEMARLLGVGPGDTLTLLAPTASGGLNALDLQVAGVSLTGVPEVDRMRVLVPLRVAQELLQSDRIRRMVVSLEDTAATDRMKLELVRQLPEFEVRAWHELAPFYRQLVGLYARQVAVFGFVIGAIVLLVVFGTVAMGVLERARDIGTLLSLGFSAATVRRIFIVEGGLVGAAGSVLGAAAAAVLSVAVNRARLMMPPPPGHTEGYPLYIAFDPRCALLVVIAMAVLGALAGWGASGRVTHFRIVRALGQG